MEDFENLETVPSVNEALQQAAPIVAELAANPEVVAALAVQGFEIDAEAVEQVVVAEAEKVVETVREGFVAGEHFVREKIDVVVGTSRIRNPA